MQYCLDPLDLRLRALDSSVGLVTLGYRTLYARLRTFVITAALIEGLLRDNLLPDKLLPAFEIGFGSSQDGITLIDERFSFSQGLFGLIEIGLRRPQLCLVFRRRYPSDHLARFDFAAFLDGDVDEPAGYLAATSTCMASMRPLVLTMPSGMDLPSTRSSKLRAFSRKFFASAVGAISAPSVECVLLAGRGGLPATKMDTSSAPTM